MTFTHPGDAQGLMRVVTTVHAEAPGGSAEEGDFPRAHPASVPPMLVVGTERIRCGCSRVARNSRLRSRHSGPHRGARRESFSATTPRSLAVIARVTAFSRGPRGWHEKTARHVVDDGCRLRPPRRKFATTNRTHTRTHARATHTRPWLALN